MEPKNMRLLTSLAAVVVAALMISPVAGFSAPGAESISVIPDEDGLQEQAGRVLNAGKADMDLDLGDKPDAGWHATGLPMAEPEWPEPAPGATPDDHESGRAANDDIAVGHGFSHLRDVDFPRGQLPIYPPPAGLGNPYDLFRNNFMEATGGGQAYAVRYDDQLAGVFHSNLNSEGFRSLPGEVIANRDHTDDNRLSVITSAAVDPDGGAYFTLSYWVRNHGDDPVDVKIYPFAQPNANSQISDTTTYDPATGVISSTNDAGSRATLGMVPCAPSAGHSIGDFSVLDGITNDEMNMAGSFTGDSWYVQSVDLGTIEGEAHVQVDFVFRGAREGGSVDDAASFCPDPGDPPLDFPELPPVVEPPENHLFENATSVPEAPYTNTQTTVGAGTQTGEPTSYPSGVCAPWSVPVGSTVWYAYSPDETQQITMDTFGSDFDTVLAVHTGDAVDDLTLVTCNDDSGSFQSEVTFNAQAGETYYMQIGGYAGDSGELVLDLDVSGEGEDPPPGEGAHHEGGGEGPGWAMYQVEMDNGSLDLDVGLENFTDMPVAQLATVVYNEDLEWLLAIHFTIRFSDDGIYVNSTVLGDEALFDTHDEWRSSGGMGMGFGSSALAGNFYFLVWATGGVGEREYSLTLGPGGQILAVEEDDTAFSYVTRDFEGPLVARASVLGLGAQAVVQATREQEVQNLLVGSFESFGTVNSNLLTMHRPDGSPQVCSCSWFDLDEDAEGPGNYSFQATGATAGSPGNLFLNVVDVRVPQPDPPEPPEPVEPDETREWIGFIGCSLNYPSAFQPWNCPDPNTNLEHEFTVQPGLKTLVVAVDWDPVQLCTADHLRHWLFVPSNATRAAVRVEGPGPLEYRVDAGDPMDLPFEQIEEPTDLRFHVWGPTGGFQFCYQQPFEVHYHLFYEEHAHEGYSALPPEDDEDA